MPPAMPQMGKPGMPPGMPPPLSQPAFASQPQQQYPPQQFTPQVIPGGNPYGVPANMPMHPQVMMGPNGIPVRRRPEAPPETTPAITVKRPGEPEAQKAVKVAARAAQAVAATALAQAAAAVTW